MDKPAISIVMPVKNGCPYLSDAITSILDQSFTNFELLCIDDGSTDGTRECLESFRSLDKRIKVLESPFLGAGGARNIGLRCAVGDYIVFLDSDDVFDRNLLAIEYTAITEQSADIAICSAYYFDSGTGRRTPRKESDELAQINSVCLLSSAVLEKRIFSVFYPVLWDKMFKRSLLLSNGIECLPIPSTNDMYCTYGALLYAKRVCYVPHRLINYRMGISTNIQSRVDRYPVGALESLKKLWEVLQQSDHDFLLNDYRKCCIVQFVRNFKTLKTVEGKEKLIDYWLTNEPFRSLDPYKRDEFADLATAQALFACLLVDTKMRGRNNVLHVLMTSSISKMKIAVCFGLLILLNPKLARYCFDNARTAGGRL